MFSFLNLDANFEFGTYSNSLAELGSFDNLGAAKPLSAITNSLFGRGSKRICSVIFTKINQILKENPQFMSLFFFFFDIF